MIQIITQENRRLFHHELMEMHAQRKTVFIDRMGWRLDAETGLEIDQFDSAEAMYLIELGEGGRGVRQSARLLPTERPHLLGDVFPALCTDAPPRSSSVWEASRFCPAPEIEKGAPRRELLARMIAAIMETGILFGIEQVTFVASAALAPLAAKAGWAVRTLGGPQRIGRERATAMIADIDSDGLARVRGLNRLAGPLTRYADPALRRAA